MRRFHSTVALIFSLSGVSVFGLLCLTVIRFQEGNMQIHFEAPGRIKVYVFVDKSRSNEENETPLLPEAEKADR